MLYHDLPPRTKWERSSPVSERVGPLESHLAAVFAIARPAWGYQLDQNAMKDAFVVAKRLGITTKSRARDRRPTMDELDSLMMHFGERLKRRPSSVPMQKIIGVFVESSG